MVSSASEEIESCSESSRQKTDTTPVVTEFDIQLKYLILTRKLLKFAKFEGSGELGAGDDSGYDAENLDEHGIDPSSVHQTMI